MTPTGKIPNPGSDAAIAKGCICPVIDNNHGRWPPALPDGWWFRSGCPLHGRGDWLDQPLPPSQGEES